MRLTLLFSAQSCLQHKPFFTSVINIDVASASLWILLTTIVDDILSLGNVEVVNFCYGGILLYDKTKGDSSRASICIKILK